MKRLDVFLAGYKRYRRTRSGWLGLVDRLTDWATVGFMACLLLGQYVSLRTGIDANGFNIADVPLGIALLIWRAADLRRFAKAINP